ncbi:MAG: hypothetical protein CMH54_03110 [Myxococcales bacterium]|nr:hypothetical protein [Myxococcales bacterium]
MRTIGCLCLLLLGWSLAGCDTGGDPIAATDSSEDTVAPTAPCAPDQLVGLDPSQTVAVSNEHRACSSVDDCVAITVGCSLCGGDCTGVQSQCGEAYQALLDCSGYSGPECDYDCRPEMGLTTLDCVDGLCTVVE